MRTFTALLRFELRLHLTAPLFWSVAVLSFALQLLTLTRTGINLGENEQIAINSAWLIFQTELVLGAFAMLPALLFVVTSITRDTARQTTELFFTTPVPRATFLLGRFTAGAATAIALGGIGMLGALAGSFMPWLDPARIAPFDWRPWAASFAYLVVPNLLVFCAIFFSIAALTRSTALTFGAALGLLALDGVLNLRALQPVPHWLLWCDPLGALPVAAAARYWTVSELNTRLPTELLLPNRAMWLGFALGALLFTLWRYRMELAVPRARRRRNAVAIAPAPTPPAGMLAPGHPAPVSALQLFAQLRMDWRGVWRSPLFWLVLALTGASVWAEANGARSPLLNMPIYPVTSLLLDSARPASLQFVLLVIIYYSAVLVHRERDCRVEGISGTCPCPDWITVTAKTLVLCAVVLSLLAVTLLAALGAQEFADFHDHAPAVFLQGLLLYDGSYYCMLCVLAVLLQVLSPGRWSGMVLVLLVFVAVLALPALGFEHLLYNFHIPRVVHSGMNGFEQGRSKTLALIAYWGAGCVLLLATAHLLFPRGYQAALRERLRDARARLTVPLLRTSAIAALAAACAGTWIFYNTNVLNDYTTGEATAAAQARYELEYGRYRDTPQPSLENPDLHVELYPAERRMESRGTAGLRNRTSEALQEFIVSVDKRNRVAELSVAGATLLSADRAQGFYRFRPQAPLAPGALLTMHWALLREQRGFANANDDMEIVANGTYVRSSHLPVPGYCIACELTAERKRFGLPPRPRLPALGDAAHLDDLWPGINSRSSFHLVIGTQADQTAVAPGLLLRSWQAGGRRYFEYGLAGPVWPLVTVQSARFEVARAQWQGTALEIYHDPRHSWNVPMMLASAQRGLEYYSREFAPYPLPYFRMAEYARYRSNVQSGVGTIAYAEDGFMIDLRGWNDLDYATLHELAHQWWGNVYGARMQGRQLLNEGLAQYSTLMAFKQFAAAPVVRRIAASLHDAYLDARSSEAVAEQPVAKTEDQGYISYDKAPLALFALQELIGADKVNGALRAYYARFAAMQPPLPTSRDLIAELRAAAGPEHQQLITDLFERIVLYDVAVTAARVRPVDGGYEVMMELTGSQFEAQGNGKEHAVPLDTWFQIAVFPASDRDVRELQPLYLRHHRLRSGVQRITVRVAEQPGAVAVDPFYLMIDRVRANNVLRLAERR